VCCPASGSLILRGHASHYESHANMKTSHRGSWGGRRHDRSRPVSGVNQMVRYIDTTPVIRSGWTPPQSAQEVFEHCPNDGLDSLGGLPRGIPFKVSTRESERMAPNRGLDGEMVAVAASRGRRVPAPMDRQQLQPSLCTGSAAKGLDLLARGLVHDGRGHGLRERIAWPCWCRSAPVGKITLS